MPTSPSFVLQEISRHGGAASARLLESLLRPFFSREERYGDDFVPADAGLDRLLDHVGREVTNVAGADPFNVIPSSGLPGACCPLCLAVALGGFGGTGSSGRRLNVNQLSLELAAHWLRCQPVNQETLILTPDWSQRTFDQRFTRLFEAYRDTGRRAFIVEVARTGLILRWPY
jgi:hypothetical protein